MSRFLGYDESNHGQFPEIVVCVLSQDSKDLKKSELGKIRSLKFDYENPDIGSIMESREFRQIIIEKPSQLDYYLLQARVITAFATYFGIFDSMIVDGSLSRDTRSELKENLPQGIASRIRGMVDADKKIPLVNRADRLAYVLYSNCNKIGLEEYKAMHADTILPLELEILVPS